MPKTYRLGFTIVELLSVIVVIGILASITVASYTGISQKATETVIKADLTNISKQIRLYESIYDTFPTAFDADGCPSAPVPSTSYCIHPSSGNSYSYTSDGLTYTISETNDNSSVTYAATNVLSPYKLITIAVTAIAAITGNTQVSQTLTAGAVTPVDATVSYQWKNATTSGGTYTNIAGATANTYVLQSSDLTKYIKVAVSGTGSYSGTRISVATSVVTPDPNWITIGTQTWATANLNVGTRINASTSQTNNATVEKYCYSDLESNCASNGGLYQWNEMMNYVSTESSQGICPSGSHVPSDNEWKTLEMQLGMSQAQADANGSRGTDQGTQMKVGGSSGLNIIIAGYYNGSWTGFPGGHGDLWNSSGSGYSNTREFGPSDAGVSRGWSGLTNAFSVRCLKN